MSVSANGFGKRTEANLYRQQSRGGMGIINFKVTNKTGNVIGAMPVTGRDGLVMLTSNNKIIRISVAEVMSRGRVSMGVKVVNLDEGASVVACDRVDNGGTGPDAPDAAEITDALDGAEEPESFGDAGPAEQS